MPSAASTATGARIQNATASPVPVVTVAAASVSTPATTPSASLGASPARCGRAAASARVDLGACGAVAPVTWPR